MESSTPAARYCVRDVGGERRGQTHELFNDWGVDPRPSGKPELPTLTLHVATRHRWYTHTVFTFFADAVADLIHPFIAEAAHAQIAPL
jgi:hypothetical protein